MMLEHGKQLFEVWVEWWVDFGQFVGAEKNYGKCWYLDFSGVGNF